MSNHLAVATVTAAIRHTLQRALDTAVPPVTGARATTARPNAPQDELPNPGVNVFLYQATQNATLRNADLPRRRGDGSAAQRPQAALDLHYLLTFHGAETQLEPQIMLGIVTRVLHERPVLTRAVIDSTIADNAFAFLPDTDLAEALESTRVTPVGLSIEELAKLWSVFYQIPYVLSAAYRASVVLLDGEGAVVQSAPPVKTTRVETLLEGADDESGATKRE